MSLWAMVFKEVRHRKVNFALAVIAVAAAVALVVSLVMLLNASQNETRRTMRDIGFNVRIVAKDADLVAFQLNGYTDATMPMEYIHELAQAGNVAYNHLTATLRQKVDVHGTPAIYVGLSESLFPPGQKKPAMVKPVEQGTVEVGRTLADALHVKKGDAITIGSEAFTIARVSPETGTQDDITILGLLSDGQRALGLEGRISEIQAMDCFCLTADEDPLAKLRAELNTMLPDAQMVHAAAIANARAKQRRMVEQMAAYVAPLVALICAGLISVLAAINVRERSAEIGLLRAIGKRGGVISGLFLGKAVVIGIIGAIIGFVIGSAVGLSIGPDLFPDTARKMTTDYQLLMIAAVGAPLFAAAASFLPAMMAVTKDPAVTLSVD